MAGATISRVSHRANSRQVGHQHVRSARPMVVDGGECGVEGEPAGEVEDDAGYLPITKAGRRCS
jgi:hypothetical protein